MDDVRRKACIDAKGVCRNGTPALGSGADTPRAIVTFAADDRLRTGLQELRGWCKPTGAHQQALAELPLRPLVNRA